MAKPVFKTPVTTVFYPGYSLHPQSLNARIEGSPEAHQPPVHERLELEGKLAVVLSSIFMASMNITVFTIPKELHLVKQNALEPPILLARQHGSWK
jgi:hypothetical protein